MESSFRFAATLLAFTLLSWCHPASMAPTEVPATTTTADSLSTTPETPLMAPRIPSFEHPRHRCPVVGCRQRQHSIQELKAHLVTEHSADPETINDSPGLYHPRAFIYRCTECGESFQRPEEVNISSSPLTFPQVPSAAHTATMLLGQSIVTAST